MSAYLIVNLEVKDAAAKAFLADPGYAPLAELRQRVAVTDMVLGEGL